MQKRGDGRGEAGEAAMTEWDFYHSDEEMREAYERRG